MSELGQAAAISGGIFVMVMATQYGSRRITAHSLLRPVAMVAAFGWIYLRHVPLSTTGDLATYGVALALGLLFGAAATVATRVVRDGKGVVRTVTGPAFVAVWALAVALRLGFVWAIDNVGFARDHVGTFMFAHQISLGAIAPFFVIWALVMVISRVVVVAGRAASLRSTAADEPARVLV